MTDDELHNMVRHLARLHGVSPEEIVAEVTGHRDGGGHGSARGSGHEHDHGYSQYEEGSGEDWDEAGGLEMEVEMASAPPQKRRRSRSARIAWWSAMVVVGALVGVVVILGMKFLNDPAAAGTLPTPMAPHNSPTPGPPGSGTSQLAGPLVTLTYPALFDQVVALTNDKRALEQYNLSSKANYRRLITVDLKPLDNGDISGDSDYRVRQLNPSVYHETDSKVGGDTVILVTKNDGLEQTLFWLHGVNILTVSVTSTDSNDNVATFMAVIKAGVKWNG